MQLWARRGASLLVLRIELKDELGARNVGNWIESFLTAFQFEAEEIDRDVSCRFAWNKETK